ncbi:MAG: RsiV family protein, partial [Eubacteriales bacterium]|nr:RsiV family protein [Eubacteriales bacterium]
ETAAKEAADKESRTAESPAEASETGKEAATAAGEEAEGGEYGACPDHLPIEISEKYTDGHVTYEGTEYYNYSYEVTMPFLKLSDRYQGQFPELAKALEDFSKEKQARFDDGVGYLSASIYDLLHEKVSFGTEVTPRDEGMQLFERISADVVRADDKIVSIVENGQSYEGGAHGNYYLYGFNYDTQTGKKLEVEDVFKSRDEVWEFLKGALSEKYGDEVGFDYYEPSSLNFMITNEGVVFFFNPYDIAPYASGLITYTVVYPEHPELFRMNIMDHRGNYMEPLLKEGENHVFTGGHGDIQLDTVSFDQKFDESTDSTSYVWYVNVNGRESELLGYLDMPITSMAAAPYYVSYDGTPYLFIFEDVGETTVLNVFKFGRYDAEKPDSVLLHAVSHCSPFNWIEYSDNLDYIRTTLSMNDPDCMIMWSGESRLLAAHARQQWRMTESGVPETDDDYIFADGDQVYMKGKMCLGKDMKANVLNENGTAGAETVLPSGTVISPLSTDNESSFTFRTDDKKEYIREFTVEGETIMIDGAQLYEVLDWDYEQD